MSEEKKPTTEQNLLGCFGGWLMIVVAIILFYIIGSVGLGFFL